MLVRTNSLVGSKVVTVAARGFALEQRHLTEERAGPEHRKLGAVACDRRRAFDEHHKLSSDGTLFGQLPAGRDVEQRRRSLQEVQLTPRALLEQPNRAQKAEPMLLRRLHPIPLPRPHNR